MVPPALVLTNKNSGAGRIVCRFTKWSWLALFLLCGCAPPGPRALLDGKKLLEEGKYREAVAELEKATTLLPKTAAAWNYLGLAYQANDEPDQAVKAYRAALALDHKLSVVRYNLG